MIRDVTTQPALIIHIDVDYKDGMGMGKGCRFFCFVFCHNLRDCNLDHNFPKPLNNKSGLTLCSSFREEGCGIVNQVEKWLPDYRD